MEQAGAAARRESAAVVRADDTFCGDSSVVEDKRAARLVQDADCGGGGAELRVAFVGDRAPVEPVIAVAAMAQAAVQAGAADVVERAAGLVDGAGAGAVLCHIKPALQKGVVPDVKNTARIGDVAGGDR